MEKRSQMEKKSRSPVEKAAGEEGCRCWWRRKPTEMEFEWRWRSLLGFAVGVRSQGRRSRLKGDFEVGGGLTGGVVVDLPRIFLSMSQPMGLKARGEVKCLLWIRCFHKTPAITGSPFNHFVFWSNWLKYPLFLLDQLNVNLKIHYWLDLITAID